MYITLKYRVLCVYMHASNPDEPNVASLATWNRSAPPRKVALKRSVRGPCPDSAWRPQDYFESPVKLPASDEQVDSRVSFTEMFLSGADVCMHSGLH